MAGDGVMTAYEIALKRQALERELTFALDTFQRKDTIGNLRKQLRDLQLQCPHWDDEHVFVATDEHCPYCGKKLVEG